MQTRKSNRTSKSVLDTRSLHSSARQADLLFTSGCKMRSRQSSSNVASGKSSVMIAAAVLLFYLGRREACNFNTTADPRKYSGSQTRFIRISFFKILLSAVSFT